MPIDDIKDDIWVINNQWGILGKVSNKRVLLIEIYAGVLGLDVLSAKQAGYPVLGYSPNKSSNSRNGTIHWQSEIFPKDKAVTSTEVVYAMKRIIKSRSNGKTL